MQDREIIEEIASEIYTKVDNFEERLSRVEDKILADVIETLDKESLFRS